MSFRPSMAAKAHVPAHTPPRGSLAAATTWSGNWFAEVAALGALGLVLVVTGYNGSRASEPWALAIYWLGMALMIAPVAARQLVATVRRSERLALVVWLGLSLYLVKVLHSPLGFTLHDEFPHWRTANDIIVTGELFNRNALQNVSALFPGMQIVVSALVELTGLPIYPAAVLLIGGARLLVVLAVYLIHERVSGSAHIAGVASLIYCAYPNFVYWSAQFGYESLALPLAITTVLAILIGADQPAGQRWAWGVGVVLLSAVIATHHLTSYLFSSFLLALSVMALSHRWLIGLAERLIAFGLRPRLIRATGLLLLGWAFPSLREPEPASDQPPLRLRVGWFGLLAVGLSMGWLFGIASETIQYIQPHLLKASNAVLKLFVQNEEAPRALFRATTSEYVLPVWERYLALAGVGLLTLAIPFGAIFIWRRYRRHPAAVLFALAALIYPVSFILRLTSSGNEISNRLANFFFLAVSFTVAVALVEFVTTQRQRIWRRLAVWATLVIIFLGAVIVGMPPWARLPGPYILMSDIRSIRFESVSAADWVSTHLERGARSISDKPHWLMMGSYGELDPVERLSWVFFSPVIGELEVRDLKRYRISYIFTDQRLTQTLPVNGIYFATGEPNGGRHSEPLDPQLLAKFDQYPSLSRIFDNGNIQIFDARRIEEPALR